MAIPAKKLELHLDDFLESELGDLEFMDEELNNIQRVFRLRQFLARYSNWTKDELKHVQLNELNEIMAQFGEAMNKATIPLATAPPSDAGGG